MITIIAGSRSIIDPAIVNQAIVESGFEITEVVSGCAHGADQHGFAWARQHNVPVNFFPAWPEQHQWAMENKHPGEHVQNHFGAAGKAAGFARNGQMAFYGKALVLIWDGQSKGSADMLRRATNLGLKVFVKTIK